MGLRLTSVAPAGVAHAWTDRRAWGGWGLYRTLCGFVIDPRWTEPKLGVVGCAKCIRLLTVA